MKRLRVTSGVAFCLASVAAGDTLGNDRVLLRAPFQNQCELDDWAPAGGDWVARDGICQQKERSENRFNLLYRHGLGWRDFVLSVPVEAGPSREQTGGVYFRSDKEGRNAYLFRFMDESFLLFAQLVDGRFIHNAEFLFPTEPGRMYQLTVEAAGDFFTFYIDGVRVGAARDETLERGTVGLYAYGTELSFGPVQVLETPLEAE